MNKKLILSFFVYINLFLCCNTNTISFKVKRQGFVKMEATYRIKNLFAKKTFKVNIAKSTKYISNFTFFSFIQGKEVEKYDDWDIAFKDLVIAINGGESYKYDNEHYYYRIYRFKNIKAGILKLPYDQITRETLQGFLHNINFRKDSFTHYAINVMPGNNILVPTYQINAMNWWDSKNKNCPICSIIKPHPDVTFIFNLGDNRYVKMRILSYYKDMIPIKEEGMYKKNSGHYTFDYQILDL